jgi:hypothetical protein
MSEQDMTRIPPEGERLLCRSVLGGAVERGQYDGYGILWEAIEGPYKGVQLETFTGLGPEKFEKAAKRLKSVGVDIDNIDTSQPTGNAYVTVKHHEYNGRIEVQGKFFDAVRVGGAVDPALAARLKHRAQLLKAGKPIVDQQAMGGFGGDDDSGLPF